MLAIGRALMTNPRLLILDEATEGLGAAGARGDLASASPVEARGPDADRDRQEHRPAARLADRHFIVEKGRVAWSGDSAALIADPAGAAPVRRRVGVPEPSNMSP